MLYAALTIVSILLSRFRPPPLHLLRKAYKTEKPQHKIKNSSKNGITSVVPPAVIFIIGCSFLKHKLYFYLYILYYRIRKKCNKNKKITHFQLF